ncbi:MAG: hypothetical protein QOH22_842 [Gemmatimonadaceae bacterium]|nr:hypothetical protein [Gemmatimonadaceae bacterium]
MFTSSGAFTRRRLVCGSIVALAFTALSATPARAQRVLGVGDDATVLPRGTFRVQTLGQWTSFDERYGLNTPGRANGTLEPLGVDFTLDSLGVKQFPNLASLQAGIQQLTGNTGWNATLGNSQLNLRDRVTTFPFLFEVGVSKRLSLGIQVPYVVAQAMTFFDVNTTGIEGNLGFNPALGGAAAKAQNAAMLSQFTADSTSLKNALDNCAANPAGSGCAQLNSMNTNGQAQGLIVAAQRFARGVNSIYSTSPFVPITGTDAQLALEAMVTSFRTAYAAYAAYGVAPITSTGPFASQTRLTLLNARTILSDSAYGVFADLLTSTTRSHFGDIDIGGKFLVYDSFDGSRTARMSPHGLNFRTAVGGIFRLPTGQIESPDNFIDVGTGRGAKAIEGRWFSDLLVGSHFWQSFVVRYNKPFADDQQMRITALPDEAFPSLYRRQMVHRQLGAAFEFETTPRLVVNDFFSISGQYVYRHKAQDHYTGNFTVPASVTGIGDITLDASTLDLETEMTEHRAGAGVSFSNLYSFEHGQAKVPFEVSYLHWQTVRGAGGNQPKYFTDQIQLRLYARLFGN